MGHLKSRSVLLACALLLTAVMVPSQARAAIGDPPPGAIFDLVGSGTTNLTAYRMFTTSFVAAVPITTQPICAQAIQHQDNDIFSFRGHHQLPKNGIHSFMICSISLQRIADKRFLTAHRPDGESAFLPVASRMTCIISRVMPACPAPA